jgi:hypothetical protein
MSSKYCCDNSTKDKALECVKCDKDKCCAVYNKDENVIYYNPRPVRQNPRMIGMNRRPEGGIFDLHKAMMEWKKENECKCKCGEQELSKPAIVKV